MATKKVKTSPAASLTGAVNSPAPYTAGVHSLDEEAIALKHLIEADEPDPNDPLYARFEVYLDRLDAKKAADSARSDRQNAEPDVPVVEAKKIASMGLLQTDKQDTMTVHTLEAMRLFLGVSPDAASANRFGIPGGRRAATALRQLFLLSAHDNPYADWKLIQADERIAELKKLIESVEDTHRKMLDKMAAKGLSYGVLQATNPQAVSLGYHSPYGYSVSTVIVLFDHCVRVLKSAERRDLCTRNEVRTELVRLKHRIRSFFELVITATRVLLDENMRGLCRADYLPQASEPGKKRVDAALLILGKVPQDVFTGEIKPRHSLRDERLSGKELEVLRQIAAGFERAESVAAEPPNAAAANLID